MRTAEDAARVRMTIMGLSSWVVSVVLAAAWSVVLLTGSPRNTTERPLGFTAASAAAERRAEAAYLGAVSTEFISKVHKEITSRPHMAGTEGARITAEYVTRVLQEAGLQTEVVQYTPWLSLPRDVHVELLLPEPEALSVFEPPDLADPDTSSTKLGPGFVAYSGSGAATGEVVYANYGLPPDFARLAAAGVPVRGRIVLARYGRSHRAVKVHAAQEAGAAAIIIYSDPADDGYGRGEMWPEGPWRAPQMIQRGNAKFSWFWHGDPLTPGTAAKEQNRGLAPETAPTLPRIPAVVLSWSAAARVLQRLGGPVAPAGFQGGLPFTYHLGPGPASVRITADMDARHRPIRDVVAWVKGTSEPDRRVLLGAHHDAWTFGGVDPGGGASVMLEVARGLAALAQSGWRPARSIVFAFWDAEEPGLIGSTEFAEDRQRELRERVVCYINSDFYMRGRFDAGGVPSLRDFMTDVARSVPDGRGSLYDTWKAAEWQRQPVERKRRGAETFDVELAPLGSGADFVAFQDHLGLPTLSLEFDFDGSYGSYHSNYDTRSYMERFGDPGFQQGTLLARVVGLTAMRLAGADVLPFRYSHYARKIAEFLDTAEGWAIDEEGRRIAAPSLDPLRARAATLSERTTDLERRIDARLQSGGISRASAAPLNDALARLEQALLDERGTASERWYRHVIYGWNIFSLYDGQPLPGLADAIRRRDRGLIKEEQARIEAALARMIVGIDRALSLLPPAPNRSRERKNAA